MSACGADDVDMGEEVAQRGIIDAESVGCDELREPRRRSSPSDPTSREIECSLCPRARSSRETPREGRKELEDGSKVPVVSWDYCFFGARNRTTEAEVEQGGDSPVLVMHDGVTKSVCAHLIPAKGVDFPSCEKVVKRIVKDLDTSGYHRVVFRSANGPSILSLLRAVKLGWTGDMVQQTSAAGDPQSNGAAESSVNAVKRTCQIDQTGSGIDHCLASLSSSQISGRTLPVFCRW